MTEFTPLQLAALNKFAADGFDGTSMSLIAVDAGIRKATIYAHFASKEELFFSLLQPVMTIEQKFMEETFADVNKSPKGLFLYLESNLSRINDSPSYLRFMLRSIYLPPESLKEKVSRLGGWHYHQLWELVGKKLAMLGVAHKRNPDLSAAYIGLMDSIQTCVLYAPDFALERLNSMWKLFRAALP